MKRLNKGTRIATAITIALTLLGVVAATFYLRTGSNTIHAASPNLIPHPMHVQPHYLSAGKPDSGGAFSCQSPGATIRCYAPKQIRQAYDITRVLNAGIKGAGTTIVIIDAYQAPAIRQDLHEFDTTFQLPDPKLNIIAPEGKTPFDPNDPVQVGWSGEISLDVEWAHAIAPEATIDLVLAKTSNDIDLLNVTQYAVDNNLGQVISQSFGEAESCADPNLLALEHEVFVEANKKGITVFASSGDDGAAQPTCDGSSFILSASTPASDPNVTSVGATFLNAQPQSGKYIGEAAWNDQYGASGGGFSSIYARPGYQSGYVHNAQRGVPDVAYNGDVNGGVLTVWSESGQGAGLIFIFGGTSAGSPQWAAMLALVNQAFGPQGNINPILYKGFAQNGYSTFFHDITVGTNTFDGIPGYNTRVGWDPVTGLGSFDLGNSILGPTGTSKTVSANHWNHR